MPGRGFAAGPCLFKDTMQLAAFNNNNFALGHTAMTINEGLPLYVVHRLEQRFDLATMTVGILGMAFKGGSDDTRSSLAYKLKRILAFKAGSVLCTDPYVAPDPALRAPRRRHRPVGPAGHRGAAPRVSRAEDRHAGRRYLEHAGQGRAGRDDADAACA